MNRISFFRLVLGLMMIIVTVSTSGASAVAGNHSGNASGGKGDAPETETSAPVAKLFPFTQKVSSESYNHTELTSNNANPQPLVLTTNTAAELTSDCPSTVTQLDAYIVFSLGSDNYYVETEDELAGIRVNISALDENSNALFTATDVLLSTNKLEPSVTYHFTLAGTDAANVRSLELTQVANSYSVNAAIDAQKVSLAFYYEELTEIDAAQAVLNLDPISSPLSGSFEHTFHWSVVTSSYTCLEVPAYQIQMMRLYGDQTLAQLQEKDWKEATNIYSESPETNLMITIAEGSGDYAWRVRPIGTLLGAMKYALSNPANWDDNYWVAGSFTFIQPDEEKNFIYSRTFTEKGRVAEQLNFANGLGQMAQSQVKLHGATDQIIASQTVQDFVGRDALSTLPVPLANKSTFGYENGVLSNGTSTFSVSDFDVDPQNASTASVKGGYYDGTVPGVADAQGVPYVRTLFTRDGTGRVREQAGVGATHALTANALDRKTTRTYYSSVDEGELVAIFGKEAPEASNVHKIITYDANNVGSITFQDKSGKVIATALDAGASADNLDELPSNGPSAFNTVTGRVTGNTRKGTYQVSSLKPLFFTFNKNVTIDYNITPATVSEICNVLCNTCDYKIEFILHNQDEPSVASTVLKTYTIQPDACANNGLWTIPESFIVNISGGTNYVLERRMSTHQNTVGPVDPLDPQGPQKVMSFLDKQLGEIKAHYTTVIDDLIPNLQAYVDADDPEGLYTYIETTLGYQLDEINNRYAIPYEGGGAEESCTEYLFIPHFEVCEGELDNCMIDGQDWEAYFQNYWTGEEETFGDPVNGELTYAYFEDLYQKHIETALSITQSREPDETQYKFYYATGELNQMFQNLLDDNADRLSCADLWEVWQQEVFIYKSYVDLEQAGIPGGGANGQEPFENNLVDRVFKSLQALLDQRKPANNTDICANATNGDPTYLVKDLLYGKIGTTEYPDPLQVPDLKLEAHRLIYLNTDEEDTGLPNRTDLLRTLANPGVAINESTAVSISDFNGLSACDKYKLYAMGGGITDGIAADEQGQQQKLVDTCDQMCENRTEEFKQAAIRALLTKNTGYVIEQHIVSFNELLGQYVAIYDPTVNLDDFDYSVCEIDIMVDALVQNCKDNYCDLDILDQNGDLEGLDANEELKLEQVFNYNFDLNLNETGQTCATGWDQLNTSDITAAEAFTQLWTTVDLDTNCPEIQETMTTFDEQGNVYAVLMPRSGKYSYLLNNSVEIKDLTGTGKFALVKFDAQGTYVWHNEYHLEVVTDPNDDFYATESTTPDPGLDNPALPEDFSISIDPNGNIAFMAAVHTEASQVSTPESWTLKHGTQTVLSFSTTTSSWSGVCTSPYVTNYIAGTVSATGTDQWFRRYDESQTGFTTLDGADNAYVLASSGLPAVIEKIASNGSLTWTSEAVTVSNSAEITYDKGQISRDAAGNIYFYNGYTTSATAATLAVAGQQVATLPANARTGVLIKYDATGAFTWVYTRPLVSANPLGLLARTHQALIFESSNGGLTISAVTGPTNVQDQIISGIPYIGSFSLLPLSANQVSIYNKAVVGEGINSLTINLSDNSFSTDYDLTQSQGVQLRDAYIAVDNSKNYVGVAFENALIHGHAPAIGGFLAPADAMEPGLCPVSTLIPSQQAGKGPGKVFAPSFCFQWTTPRALEIPLPVDTDIIFDPALPASCEAVIMDKISNSISFQKESLILTKQQEYRDSYRSRCVDPALFSDEFTISYPTALHHFTLYYYDRAGNLMTTIPPEGVARLDVSTLSNLSDAKDVLPAHTFKTRYAYNSLGQLIGQETPDAGLTSFIYNDVGQLRFSQNAKQRIDGTYSYTHYDALGRITEVGLATGDFTTTARANRNDLDWPTGGAEVTRTVYNAPYPESLPTGYTQSAFLRNRISYVYSDPDGLDNSPEEDRVTTIYSYDPHGNVAWLVQDIPGLGQKTIDYQYDLLSGNVLEVAYNQGNEDQFFHRYAYDQDNRVSLVETSLNRVVWERDASYDYYAHGPLKQTVIGEDQVQELDYLYTIHGWLKAINDPASPEGAQTGTTRDAFAMILHYYSGDYLHSSGTVGKLEAATGRDLYNGNISAWENANQNTTGTWTRSGMQYTYDELNRIKSSTFNVHREDAGLNVDRFYTRKAFATDYTFDGNGNLMTLNRDDFDGERMDQLVYSLEASKNRLASVLDESGIDPGKHPDDIEGTNNYVYDAIGNLITDEGSGVNIDWTVYGKVRATSKLTQPAVGTGFIYDAAGNRVAKQSTDQYGAVLSNYYVRDASGNVMAIYRDEAADGIHNLTLNEVPVYGSDRLGMYRPGGSFGSDEVMDQTVTVNYELSAYKGISEYYVEDGASLKLLPGFDFTGGVQASHFLVTDAPAVETPQENLYSRALNRRIYELKDHLGNIRATISDKKQPLPGGNAGEYMPTLLSSLDYYPYGMDRTPVVWESVEYLATFETDNTLFEQTYFNNRDNIQIVTSSDYNVTVPTETYDKGQRLSSAEGKIIGLGKQLTVQAGDKVSMEVYGKYLSTSSSPVSIGSNLAGALLTSFGLPAGELQPGSANTLEAEFALGSIFAYNGTPDGVRAYLNYVFLDENYTYVTGGYAPLENNVSDPDAFQHLTLEYIPDQDGYLFVYLSDESQQETEVYFDDFKVTHEVLIKELQLEAYRYGFNGKEKDSKGEFGLNHYDYGFRIYNPSIAKFLSVDPLTKSYPWYTPYQFAGNKPIWAIDLDGLEEYFYTLTFNDDGEAHFHLDKQSDYWLMPDVHKVSVPQLGLSFSFTWVNMAGNYFPDFKYFKEDPLDAILNGYVVSDEEQLKEAGIELLTDLAMRKLMPSSPSKKRRGKGFTNEGKNVPDWLKKVREGIKFQRQKLRELIQKGTDHKTNIRLVPQNGKGNINGNRTDADALIRNEDGTYTMMEYKLNSTTPLSTGQNRSKSHVNKGDGMFEIKTAIPEWNLEVGDKIKVTTYQVETKN